MKNEQVAAGTGGFFVTIATAAGSTTKKVDGDLLTVGRADDCHLTISHETLSRRHLSISLKDGAIWIEDHASSNGTFVNGRRIPPHSLTRVLPEDQITMGQAGVRLSVSAEQVMRMDGVPPVPATAEQTSSRISDTIVTSTQNLRHAQRVSAPAPKAKETDEAQAQAERTLQEAQKKATGMIQEAEIEAERRVEDIYRRAHETQAKMDEVYQRRMNEAYRASEQVYQKSQEESQRIMDIARQKATEIRMQGENFVMELRRRTEEDCERMLAEAQQTARDLKEQRLLEAEDIVRKKEEEMIARTREAMNDRMARFEQDLQTESDRQRADLEVELNRKRDQLDLDQKDQLAQLSVVKDEIKALRDSRAREQDLLGDVEFKLKKLAQEARTVKEEIEVAKRTVSDSNQQLESLRVQIESSSKERVSSEAQAKESRASLASLIEEIKAAEKRVKEAQERSENDLLQLRAKFEEDKARMDKQEQAHFEEMKLQTTRKIREMETRMIEELSEKRDLMTRELTLAVEAYLKEHGEHNHRELQDLIGTHFKRQILTLASDESAKSKQATLIALKRRQKIWAIASGMAMGAVMAFTGQRLEHYLRKGHSPMQERVTEAQEQRKADLEQRRFNPPQTLDFKATYVDNVVYTENFVAKYTSDDFQNKFLKGLTPYMFKTWRVEEEQVITLLGISSTLVKSLAEKRANIHPDFVQQGLDKMKDTEAEALGRMRDLLGSQVRVESFKKFEKQFYEAYVAPASAHETMPPRTPSNVVSPADDQ